MFSYAEKIKEYRRRKLLTQSELAALLQVSAICITRWERGKFEPSIEAKRKLYRLFLESGIQLDD